MRSARANPTIWLLLCRTRRKITLFGTVSDADWSRLASGFGRRLSSIFVEDEFRPLRADKSAMNSADIEEIRDLIDAIYERILNVANTPATTAKPEIVAVSDLLEAVSSGEVRVPRFQRPYVWTRKTMLQLFDSVLRGYPIGSLLIWQTDREDITSLDAIGPIKLPIKRASDEAVCGRRPSATCNSTWGANAP